MRRSRRIAWWTAYGAGVGLVVAGLAWTSVRVVSLEREEREARHEAERQEELRIALRAMDAWFSPRIAREAARMWFEYEPYYPQTIAFNRLLEPIATGEVLVPSPLLGFSSPVFPLHFQWRASTGFTSPQVPSAAMQAEGLIACSPVPTGDQQQRLLAEWSARMDPRGILAQIEAAESSDAAYGAEGVDEATTTSLAAPAAGSGQPAPSQSPSQSQSQSWMQKPYVPGALQDAASEIAMTKRAGKSDKADYRGQDPADLSSRVKSLDAVQQTLNLDNARNNVVSQSAVQAQEAQPTVQTGPLVPIWLTEARDQLILARRVRLGDESMLQGVVVDWSLLRQDLLDSVGDLASEATLLPTSIDSTDPARLVSLPVVVGLSAADSAQNGNAEGRAAALGLGLVWVAVLSAIGVTGLALRSSIGNAVRTSRFASSVTHELRTPLTTFRLYSEMLADGIVPDPKRQREYLETLRDESARLGLLVENVLAWSRVEEGRSPSEPRPITVESLVAETMPVLGRRCEEGGVSFSASADVNGTRVTTDPDRVRQVLFNLVDNACKYAGRGAAVELRVAIEDGRLALRIEDNGPGVPERLRRRIFRAFDRGERGPGDSVRGLGLGLAISNELARSLGGRLRCGESTRGTGAAFTLELPL